MSTRIPDFDNKVLCHHLANARKSQKCKAHQLLLVGNNDNGYQDGGCCSCKSAPIFVLPKIFFGKVIFNISHGLFSIIIVNFALDDGNVSRLHVIFGNVNEIR